MSQVYLTMEQLRTSNPVIRFTARFLTDMFRQFQNGINSDFETLLRIRSQRRIQPPFVNYLALAENLEVEFHYGFTRHNLGPMLGCLLRASLHDLRTEIGASLPITALVVLCERRIPSEQYFRNFIEYPNDLTNIEMQVFHANHLSQLNAFNNWGTYLEAIRTLFPD